MENSSTPSKTLFVIVVLPHILSVIVHKLKLANESKTFYVVSLSAGGKVNRINNNRTLPNNNIRPSNVLAIRFLIEVVHRHLGGSLPCNKLCYCLLQGAYPGSIRF